MLTTHPFHTIHHLRKFVYPLKLLGIFVAFSYENTVSKHIIQNSPKYQEDIVYKIKCSCGRFYIGQTGKCLRKRISQHQYQCQTNVSSNAINAHSRTCNNPIDWNSPSILYKNNNFIERNLIESACINFSNMYNFNTSPGLYKTDPLFYMLLTDSIR